MQGTGETSALQILITEQFLQPVPRGAFARVVAGIRLPVPQRKFKILAEIADVFFQHRLGPAFAALISRARIIMGAVQADPQVGPAFHAGFAAAGLAAQGPGFAAVVTMACHLIYNF